MVDLRVATLTGSETVVSEAAFEEFRANLRGQLIKPSDQDYDDARTIWNATIDKRPALIARCAGVADVINSVNFARANNLLVAVRGGGQNITGNAVCDGGIVIDLTPMRGIRVDPVNRTARAGATPSPTSAIAFFHMHGAATRVGSEETAFGLRGEQWDYDIIAQWNDPAEAEGHIRWARYDPTNLFRLNQNIPPTV